MIILQLCGPSQRYLEKGKTPYRMTLQLCVDRSTSGDKYDDTAALWTEPQVFGGENIQYNMILYCGLIH